MPRESEYEHTLPAHLTPVTGAVIRYAYHPVTGLLDRVTDPLANTFELRRDVQGRLDTLLHPASASPARQTYGYDSGSRLDHYELLLRSGAGGLIEATTLGYDARQKLLQSANASGGQEVRTAGYSGLGFVVGSSQSTTGTNQLGQTVVNDATTTYEYDPLGNSHATTYQSSSGSPSANSWSQRNATATFDPVSGRLVRVNNGSQAGDRDTLYYDAAGNRVFQTRSGRGAGLDRASFYAADGRLRAVDARTVGDLQALSTVETITFEEYRYDALGRRVRTRTRSWCDGTNNNAACSFDYVRRTIWDGAHTLGQIQMPHTDAEREWDGLPVEQQRLGDFDPNPHLGQVVYTGGPAPTSRSAQCAWATAIIPTMTATSAGYRSRCCRCGTQKAASPTPYSRTAVASAARSTAPAASAPGGGSHGCPMLRRRTRSW